ncbi:phage major capsid protein [Porphyrobacter sp. LM 6]|uniref:phage major capsid protein n=1 Tax=Porphyrobacter sp. LM 6 TaxID=1896196 RepID=UPI000863AFE9|nr:phage major capsid protein [Porphyrobacter sp. LM 6]AOL94667.1 phage major capsid protein, HK97 family [Porphyrobacter sp. LM 6]
MSIQAAREKMARTHGAALAFDSEFFAKAHATREKLDATQAHPADWHRLRSSALDKLNALAEASPWTQKHQAAFDHCEAIVEYCNANIDLMAFSGKPGADGKRPAAIAAPNSGWIDAKTKEPIRVYKPSERIAAERGGSDVSLGALLEGMLIGPRNAEVKAALESGIGTAGGFTVPMEIAREFWDLMRAKSVFIQAGANTVPLSGPTRMIQLTRDPEAVWRGENQSIGDTEIEVGAVELNPKSLSALVKVPYELLADSVNVEQILMNALLASLSLELDRACLFGQGTAHRPVGLYNTPGIGALSMGTNGAQISNYDPLVDMVYELELANAAAPTAIIWHPRTGRDLRKRKDTTNQPLLAPDPIPSIPKLATTSVPINLTQGTANGVASTIVMGNFDDAIVGMREELTIQRLDQTFADNGQVGFWAHLRADVGFPRPKSFVKLDGVLAG